jgi:hypothetical protein
MAYFGCALTYNTFDTTQYPMDVKGWIFTWISLYGLFRWLVDAIQLDIKKEIANGKL